MNGESTSRAQRTFDAGGVVPLDVASEDESKLLNSDAMLVMVVKLPVF